MQQRKSQGKLTTRQSINLSPPRGMLLGPGFIKRVPCLGASLSADAEPRKKCSDSNQYSACNRNEWENLSLPLGGRSGRGRSRRWSGSGRHGCARWGLGKIAANVPVSIVALVLPYSVWTLPPAWTHGRILRHRLVGWFNNRGLGRRGRRRSAALCAKAGSRVRGRAALCAENISSNSHDAPPHYPLAGQLPPSHARPPATRIFNGSCVARQSPTMTALAGSDAQLNPR